MIPFDYLYNPRDPRPRDEQINYRISRMLYELLQVKEVTDAAIRTERDSIRGVVVEQDGVDSPQSPQV